MVSLLTDVLAHKSTSQVDQISELISLATTMSTISELAALTAQPSLSTPNYQGKNTLSVQNLVDLGLSNTSGFSDSSYGQKRWYSLYNDLTAYGEGTMAGTPVPTTLNELQQLVNKNNNVI